MNSSLAEWSKISSTGARASEQPRISANGFWIGAWPGTSENPSESGLEGINTGWPSPSPRISAWTRAMISPYRRLPSRRACSANSAVSDPWKSTGW